MVRDRDGTRWLRMSAAVKARLSMLPGIGYSFGFTGKQLSHLLIQAGLGLSLYGRWTTYMARGRMSRVHGSGAYAHLGLELGIPLTKEAAPTHLSFPLRLQQVFAFGRHGIMAVAAAGPRWDLKPMDIGLQVSFGLGYALLLPPAGVPVLVQVIRQSHGAYTDPVWGLRVTFAWPLTW